MNEQPQRETFFGACPHDCPDTCAMVYEVEDGKLVEVRGNKDHPMTRGTLCVKLKDFHDHHANPDRLKYPLRRTGPKGSKQFERISWDEAIAEIGRRWREIIATYGSQAIMPYSYLGNMGLVQGINSGDPFFNRLGTTVNEKTFCASGSSTAWLLTVGPTGGVDPESFVHSKFIVIWACNSISTNLHHWPFVLEAQKRGAKVVVIDSYRSRTAKAGDWHICPRPGTDGALAMGIINSIIAQGLVDRDYVDQHTYGFEELKARAAEFTPDYVERITGVKASDIRTVRQGVRHHAAIRDPPRRGARAARRRRAGDPRGLRAAGAGRILEACRRRSVADAAVGLPGGLDEGVARRLDQARHAGDQQSQARRGADRRDAARPAAEEPVRVLHQSGEPGARDQQDRQGTATRGSVHRRRRAFPHRHGEICRHRASRGDGRRSRGHDVVVGAFLFHLQSEGDRPARRMQADQRYVAACWPRKWASTIRSSK